MAKGKYMRVIILLLTAVVLTSCSVDSSRSSRSGDIQREILDVSSDTAGLIVKAVEATGTASAAKPVEPTTTLEPKPTPIGPLSEDGPWLVYLKDGELVAVNSDGTGRTILDLPTVSEEMADILVLEDSISPRGDIFAVRLEREGQVGWDLWLISLPDGYARIITSLLSSEEEEKVVRGLSEEVKEAVLERHAMQWSPDGRSLAFVAALDGPSADIYIYNTWNDEMKRLTTGSNQAASPFWSSDGNWIVHQEIERFNAFGEWDAVATWAASPDGSTVLYLYGLPRGKGREFYIGGSEGGLVVYRWFEEERGLYHVDLKSSAVKTLYEGLIYSVAMDPNSGAVAFTAGESENPLLYWIDPKVGVLKLVTEEPCGYVRWDEAYGEFVGNFDLMFFEVSVEGVLLESGNFGDPTTSPNGEWVAWITDSLELTSLDKEGYRVDVEYPLLFWSPDSTGLAYLDEKDLWYLSMEDGEAILLNRSTDINARYDGAVFMISVLGIGWLDGE